MPGAARRARDLRDRPTCCVVRGSETLLSLLLQMISQLASLMLAIPMGLDKALSALHDKLSPSIHAKAALDAKVAMLAEMNTPNRRSKVSSHATVACRMSSSSCCLC